jgi:hypothetical protein
VRDCFSEQDKLEFEKTLAELLATIHDNKACVAVGTRKVDLCTVDNPKPFPWKNLFFLIAPPGEMPSKIRVPKRFELS